MLPLIITAALGVAYVTRKKYDDASRLNTAKNNLIQKIYDEYSSWQETLRDFKSDIRSSLDDEMAFMKPFEFLEPPSDFTRFNYALKFNSCGRQLSFYGLLIPFTSSIRATQDSTVIEWLESHIGYYTEMVDTLYFNIQDISYKKIESITKERNSCSDASKIASLNSDIAACKDTIEFIEFFLPYYRSMIIKIASDHSKIDVQDDLHRNLRFLALIINRKSNSLKDIFDTKRKIKEHEELLATQTTDWQKYRTSSLLARYRSQLTLDTLELYFLMVLKKYFLANQTHPIDLLERYNATYEKFKLLHETNFPSIYVKGTEILNCEHQIYDMPQELFDEIKSYPMNFVLPIPECDEIFKHCVVYGGAPVIKVVEATQAESLAAITLKRPELKVNEEESQQPGQAILRQKLLAEIGSRSKKAGPPPKIPPRPKKMY